LGCVKDFGYGPSRPDGGLVLTFLVKDGRGRNGWGAGSLKVCAGPNGVMGFGQDPDVSFDFMQLGQNTLASWTGVIYGSFYVPSGDSHYSGYSGLTSCFKITLSITWCATKYRLEAFSRYGFPVLFCGIWISQKDV
jgi:hypothetical protein